MPWKRGWPLCKFPSFGPLSLLSFPNLFILNPIFFQIPEAHALILSFGNSTLHLWKKIICSSDLLYTSDLGQFSLGSYSSLSLLIPMRKVSLLISSLAHPRSYRISPRVELCVTVIFLRDNQDIPRTAFPFYYKVFILAPSRTVDSTVTVLRSHWCSPELGLYFKSIKLAVNGALSLCYSELCQCQLHIL